MIRKGDTLLFDAPPTVAAWAAAGAAKRRVKAHWPRPLTS